MHTLHLNKVMKPKKLFLFSLILTAAFIASGCGWIGDTFGSVSSIVGLNETATVIVPRAYIRSSYAVVAADLLEVKRGETLDILDETDYEKVRWFRVRAKDEDATEGWIEAQNVIVGELLEKSKKLAEEDKDAQPQASAELRAASNLRLSPEMSPDNILFKLENGAVFDIIGWKLVPKAQDAADVDDAPKTGQTNNAGRRGGRNEEIEAAKQESKPEELEDKYDIWYKVRLDPSVSPAPSGWVFGRQVQLQVPNDILYYQIGQKRFVTWQRLDPVDPSAEKVGKDKDAARLSRPGSWVILSRSNFVKSKDGGADEPDFDGILVLYYDKYTEEHTTVYRSGEVWGKLPLRLEGAGDNKTFVVNLRNAAGQFEEKRFAVFKNARGHLQVTPPADIPKPER
jgi:hypothetical protein